MYTTTGTNVNGMDPIEICFHAGSRYMNMHFVIYIFVATDQPKIGATKGQLSILTRWQSRLFADNKAIFHFSWLFFHLASTIDSKIFCTNENLWIISRRAYGSVFIRNVFRMKRFSSKHLLKSSTSFKRFSSFFSNNIMCNENHKTFWVRFS